MKKIIYFLCVLVSLQAAAQTKKPTAVSSVPKELITNDSTYWTISTLSGVNYVNTTPGAGYGTTTGGGGMIVKFKFLPNGRYSFQLYVRAYTYGSLSEAWTETEGKVIFTKDDRGQDIFLTKAEKGIYRTYKNGVSGSRAIPKDELNGQHSGRYIWQKTSFADDPQNIYLLMVDLKEHPGADVNKAGSIQPEWVSRFHIPAK